MYKERMSNLLNEIARQNPEGSGMRAMMFNAVETGLRNFVSYVNRVYEMETSVSIARFRANSTEEYQDIVSKLDSERRTSHEAAIASVNMIDRMCDRLGIEKIYGGSQDRNEIGDFCGNIVNEYFEGRTRGRVIARDEIDQVIEEEMEFER